MILADYIMRLADGKQFMKIARVLDEPAGGQTRLKSAAACRAPPDAFPGLVYVYSGFWHDRRVIVAATASEGRKLPNG